MTVAVSIVLPVYNRLALLREAVASVFAQTFDDWELIVADDGSNDETRAWLRSISDVRVHWLPLSHTGNPGAVRNAAIAHARGEYIAFLDSDDRWLPHKLAVQLSALRCEPGYRWSYSAFARIDGAGRRIEETQHWWSAQHGQIFIPLLDFAAVVPTPTVMVERSLSAEIGGFDETLAQFEDYHLWLRLSRAHPVLLVDQPLVEVRAHDEHYYQPGLAAKVLWRRMLEKLGGLQLGAAQSAALAAACRRNTLQLARGHAAQGDSRAAAQLLAEGQREHRGDPRWWIAAAVTRLYVAAPQWARGGYRRLRRVGGPRRPRGAAS